MRLGVDAGVSGSRAERVWEQRRMRLGAEALTGIGNGRADALLFSFIISDIP